MNSSIDVSCETLMRDAQLQIFVQNLQKWQKIINLTANDEEIWQRHIAQSVQLVQFFPQEFSTLADFGSGAGFPGLIAAHWVQKYCTRELGRQFHLIDSNRKKAAFLRETARLMGVEIMIHNQRIETMPPQKFDVVTARALAPLPKLLDYLHPFMHTDSIALLYKGKNYQNELTQARKSWKMNFEVIPLSEQASVLLLCKEIHHVRK